MTDNEIMKALECCTEDIPNCDECPYDHYCSIHSQEHNVLKDALDLITRQKAEIERLKEYEEIRPTGCPNCHRGNFSNSKFCSHCGTRLQSKKKEVLNNDR